MDESWADLEKDDEDTPGTRVNQVTQDFVSEPFKYLAVKSKYSENKVEGLPSSEIDGYSSIEDRL